MRSKLNRLNTAMCWLVAFVLGIIIVLMFLVWRPYHQGKLNSELIEAISNLDSTSALSLLDSGADPNVRITSTQSPKSLLDFFNGLANRSVTPERAIVLDSTALMIAAGHEDLEVVRSLLNHGARIEDKDKYGNTALTYSAIVRRYQNLGEGNTKTLSGEVFVYDDWPVLTVKPNIGRRTDS